MGSNSSTVEMSLSLLVLGVTVLVDSTLTHSIVTRIPVTHTPGRSHFTPSNLATKRFVNFGSTSQRQFNLPPLLSNTKRFRKTETETEPLQTVVLDTQGDEGRPGTPQTLEALKSLLTLEELVEAVKSLEPEEAREVLKELETQVVNIDRIDFEEFSVMLHPEEELAGTL